MGRRPLPPEVLEPLRALFGKIVADDMDYTDEHAEDLGRHLQVAREGDDLWMAFDWCGDNQLASTVGKGPDLEDVIRAYAKRIAEDLKEHRGRYGEALPWD